MKIVKPSIEILGILDQTSILKHLELVGRTCYKSEDKITETSCFEFVRKIIKSGHHAIIEHFDISVKVICDRGVTHEVVRHRIASYAQESTRYCNYARGKFGNEITAIIPCFWNSCSEKDTLKYEMWEETMKYIEKTYIKLIELGATPQEARSVLPNSLKTEIIVKIPNQIAKGIFNIIILSIIKNI